LAILSELGGKSTNQSLIGSVIHLDFLFRKIDRKSGNKRF
jgi:hypothetical protein